MDSINEQSLLIAHTAFCIVIAYSSWCRIITTTKNATRRAIRWSFAWSTAAAVLLALAPFLDYIPWWPTYVMHWSTVFVLAGFTFVQISTAYYWRKGVPASFQQRRGEK